MLPPSLGCPEGGPGLDVLRSLLVPENRSKSNPSSSQDVSSKLGRFIVLSIKRAGSFFIFFHPQDVTRSDRFVQALQLPFGVQ